MWNINGARNKLERDQVVELFDNIDADVIILTETHFKVRHKTPKKYFLVAKSKTEYKNKARGGVAIYVKERSVFNIDILSTDFYDLVVCNIRGSDVVIAAVYLPPAESNYYSSDYFDALDLMCHTFSNRELYVLGDFNSRIGTPTSPSLDYQPNPDIEINNHGKSLLDIINKHNLTVVNGCISEHTICNTAFTYHLENRRSQIDLALCTKIDYIQSFKVEPICPTSDHCPVTLSINVNIRPPLSMIRECCRYSLSHDHLDINKQLPPPINAKRIDVTLLTAALDALVLDLQQLNINDVDTFSNKLAAGIYNACRTSQTKDKLQLPVPNPNCTSKNIQAICSAHFSLYNWKIKNDAPADEINNAAKQWWQYRSLAAEMEKKEYNTRVNKTWSHCRKNDSRKMWKMIDWKGKCQQLPSAELEPSSVHNYFKDIFQSVKTSEHPTISSISGTISAYTSGDHPLNQPFSMDEVDNALRNVGNGTGIDGVPPIISNLFPRSLREILLRFLQTVYSHGPYPKPWTIQLLFPVEKKGHTILEPKLRGIAVSSLTPRVYDTLIDRRFHSWYIPNMEQSGFRELQGCLFQLFFVSLLLETARQSKKDLYLLLVDYEKAFDFANRAIIVSDMMKHNLGDTFVRAVSDMYVESTYVPKIDQRTLGDPITTFYGVTQGRRSSTGLFSFLIRDMADTVNTNVNYADFMEPHNLAQMADDTILAAELRTSLGDKFGTVKEFSDEKKQSVNVDKTLYVHMSKTPDTEPILCNNNTVSISSLEIGKSSPYLGEHLIHTNNLHDIIQYNLNIRKFNIAKYKAWLDVNENTPFGIKLLVLDSCVLKAILYGSETWGDLSAFDSKLEIIELDLLKSALGVKKGTPTNLVYHELNRGSITTRIMDLQYSFIQKLKQINDDEALVKCFWNKSQHLDIAHYYNTLDNNNYKTNISERTQLLRVSERSLDIRYRDIIGLDNKNCLYDSYCCDTYRTIITRWRLSNYELAIETGRYARPKLDRPQRVCRTCLVLEDEEHVFFTCPLYNDIRRDSPSIFNKSITDILNPKTTDLLYETANVLFRIEKIHKKFNGT